MKRKHAKKPSDHVKIAKERIKELFKQAEDATQTYANRYVALARKISMKYKVKFTPVQKKKFCKHCHVHFRQGENCRVRTRDGKLVYFCMGCEKYMRFPTLKKNSKKQ